MNTVEIDHKINNKKYVLLILKIIFLTNLPALVMLLSDFKSSIGWMAGSLASGVNFWFMAKQTFALMPKNSKANALKTSKIFMFRFLFLILWSVLVLLLLKAELMSYCLGLFSAQIAIVAHQIYHSFRYGKLKKYFRGNDE